MFKNLKLGPKFFLSLTLISITPLAISSLFNFYYSKGELERKTIGSLRAINDSRAAHINHIIQLRQEQAKELAGTFVARQLRADGFNEPDILQGIQAHIESIFRELKLTPRSAYKHIDQSSDIDNISVWDIYGNIVANTNKSLIGKKMPFTFLHILYEQGAHFKGFEKDPLTGDNVLTILEGIRNWETGEYAGAIFIKTKAKILNDITTARKGLGETAESYIVDKNLLMITESRFKKDAILNVRVNTAATQSCFREEEAPVTYLDYQGRTVLGVQTFLPDQEWCLITEMDIAEAFAPITAYRNQIMVVAGVLILVILILGHMSGRTFIRPIVNLRNASMEVAKGNYSVNIVRKSNDELGELSEAFSIMARNLSAATTQLKEKNKQLEEQTALLEKANAELDSFVYTASHDLRAPLRGISSFAQFLEEDYTDKLDDEGKDYVHEIQKGAQRLSTFIEDLLTLSRISRIQNPYEEVNVRALIKSITERIDFDIKEKKVQLKIQDNLPVVVCDRIKIGEVFQNLINNAIKFSSKMENSTPCVELGYIEEEEHHRFFVKDNGIGIAPKYHDQIFGIFRRLHTDKEYEGSGAGLSIVKRVIDDHGGKVWIGSEEGKGATFFFTIPKGLKVKNEPVQTSGQDHAPRMLSENTGIRHQAT